MSVSLPAPAIADFGNDVGCVDVDVAKIEALSRGKIPIYEPGLDKIVSRNVPAEGRLHFTTNLGEAIGNARAIFIAVGHNRRRRRFGGSEIRRGGGPGRLPAYMNGPKLVITQVDCSHRHRPA